MCAASRENSARAQGVPYADVLEDYMEESIRTKLSGFPELSAETITDTVDRKNRITDHVKKWDYLSFKDKRAVVDVLIEVIHIADGKMETTWRI